MVFGCCGYQGVVLVCVYCVDCGVVFEQQMDVLWIVVGKVGCSDQCWFGIGQLGFGVVFEQEFCQCLVGCVVCGGQWGQVGMVDGVEVGVGVEQYCCYDWFVVEYGIVQCGIVFGVGYQWVGVVGDQCYYCFGVVLQVVVCGGEQGGEFVCVVIDVGVVGDQCVQQMGVWQQCGQQ